MEALHAETIGRYRVEVHQDEDPTPPWEWDWGALAWWADSQRPEPVGDAPALGRYWRDYHETVEDAIRARVDVLAIRVVRGTIYQGQEPMILVVTREGLELTGARDADELADACAAVLRGWLDGDVYGYAVVDIETGETMDSCSGIGGRGTWGDDTYADALAEGREVAQMLKAADDADTYAAVGY